MIGEQLSFVCQIYRPEYISQKWFSTQNVPNDVMFQMMQTTNSYNFSMWKILENPLAYSFKVFNISLKPITPWFLADFSTITKSSGSGSVSFET